MNGAGRPRDLARRRGAARILVLVVMALLVAMVDAALATSLAGCKSRSAPTAGAAHRIVSLSPSTTEALYAMGAQGFLVGRSRYCDHPRDVLALPQVGGYVDPSIEAILGLQPDLVIGARGPAGQGITERLGAQGIATYFPPAESFAEVEAMMLGLGERTGHRQDAQAAAERIEALAHAVETAVAGKGRPRVLLVFGVQPVVAAGPGSFADEMLRRAGADNVVTAPPGGPQTTYPVLGMERVLAADPDVVVNAAMAEDRAEERLNAATPGWRNVHAVREGRVLALRDERILRPGPRVAEGLVILARALHPDVSLPQVPPP